MPLQFKVNGKIRPVAPFLEVFAVTDDGELEPLTVDLLNANGFSVKDVYLESQRRQSQGGAKNRRRR